MSALALIRDSARRAEAVPCQYARFTAWQRAFRRDESRLRLLLAANQVGKTYAVVHDIVDTIRGSNDRSRPWRGPINTALLSESIEQMAMEGAVLEQLWSAIPKGEIDPRVRFERGRGIVGAKEPAIKFIAGPGAGSVIRLRTFRQDPRTYAGSVLHEVWCDEPMPERVYGELGPRLLRQGGRLTYSLTPVPDMPDQTWAREMLERGAWSLHRVEMRPEHTQPEGYARPLLSQEQIDEYIDGLLAMEVGMRTRAEWEPISTDRALDQWTGAAVRPFHAAECSGWTVIVAVDHGVQAGKQCALLLLVRQRPMSEVMETGIRDRLQVRVLDEYRPRETTSPEEDAEGILDMLARHGMRYRDVDHWVGDRSAQDARAIKKKSNGQLRYHLLERARIPHRDPAAKVIVTPRKYHGSVYDGVRKINVLLKREALEVHPRCEATIDAAENWQGAKLDPRKDPIDALRYGIQRAESASGASLVVRGTMG